MRGLLAAGVVGGGRRNASPSVRCGGASAGDGFPVPLMGKSDYPSEFRFAKPCLLFTSETLCSSVHFIL